MEVIYSLGMGYLIGCISPAAWISKKKNVDLKQQGTKNLGATNTALVLGRYAGYFVLFFDMFKSIFSYKLARFLFPQLMAAGIIACIGVILGHCFPVTMGFQGGKGLAAFGGLVLAHSVKLFCILLSFGIVVAFIMDYGVYLAVSAAALFPILNYLRSGNLSESIIAAIASTIIIMMHWTNLRRAISGEDPIHIRNGMKKIFGKK